MSQLKNVAVIVAAMFMYGDEVSTLECVGYAVATAGFIGFNLAKARDNVQVRELVARRGAESDARSPERVSLLRQKNNAPPL